MFGWFKKSAPPPPPAIEEPTPAPVKPPVDISQYADTIVDVKTRLISRIGYLNSSEMELKRSITEARRKKLIEICISQLFIAFNSSNSTSKYVYVAGSPGCHGQSNDNISNEEFVFIKDELMDVFSAMGLHPEMLSSDTICISKSDLIHFSNFEKLSTLV